MGGAGMTPEARRRLLAAYLERQATAPVESPRIPRRAAGAPAPLSFAQQQVWLHAQLAPDVPLYNEPITLRRRGSLDVAALEQALGEIVRRHEAWRTAFAVDNGEPMQTVHPAGPFKLAVVDLRSVPGTEREARAHRLAVEDAVRPFDLGEGPLVRVLLVHVADDDHRLFLTLHHLIHDGVSVFGVLVPELTTLYAAFVDGRPSPLPDLPLQYPDFAVWQRGRLTGDALAPHLDYWRRCLGDAPALELPTDRVRPAVQTFRGAMQRIALPKSLADDLKIVSASAHATLFMTGFAAFVALLHRYTEQDDLVVGTVTAGRKWPEVQRLLGFFANPLPLRVHAGGDPTVRELLGRVREAALEALAHDEVPFERLVVELQRQHDPSRNPLFQTVFALEAPRVAMPPGWELDHLQVDPGTSKFDIYLELADLPEGLVGRCVYRTDLFEAATIERLVRHYRRVLEAFAGDPDRRLSTLPLLTNDERRQILEAWSRTPGDHLEQVSISRVFEAQAARRADAVAIACGDERLSYRELNRRANRLAHHLRRLGVGTGSLVGLCMERSFEMVVGLLGILKAGGAYLPLDPAYPRELLGFMLEDARASVLLTQRRLHDALPRATPRTICVDTEWDSIASLPSSEPDVDVSPDALAYVMYTSGSTGRPKGVAIPHRGVLRLVLGQEYVRLDADEVLLQAAPIAFDAATFELWGALLHGGRCVLFPPEAATPRRLGDVIARHRVTTLWLTASLFNTVIDDAPGALSGIRQLLIGGEALSVPHVRRALALLPETQIVNGYGPTESTTFACCHPIPRELPAATASIPIGRPIANTQVYVLDRRLNPVPVGVPGELFIGGAGLAREYLNRPELTAARFIAHPFVAGQRLYRTGDRVRWRPDGTLDFLGRLDDQVKIRGFRVEPGEVEAALARHPAVREASVITRESGALGRTLVAYVVPQPGAHVEPGDLRRFLKTNLPPHMLPAAFMMLEALPLTPSGKVDRQALPEVRPGRFDGARAVGPRDALEGQLIEIWEDLLDVRPIGLHDDFFDVGGHSLLATRLMQQLGELTGQSLPLATLHANPTVEQLAEVLRSGDAGAAEAPMVKIHTQGRRRPLFFFHGDIRGPGLYCTKLARRLGADQPLYVVHPLGRDGQPMPRTIEAMAVAHLAMLREVQPHGPYRIGGYCNGALVAFEIARLLARGGEMVELLVLIAAEPDRRLPWAHGMADWLAPRVGLSAETALEWFGRLRLFVTDAGSRPARDRVALALRKVGEGLGLLTRAQRDHTRDKAFDRYFRAVMGYFPRPYPGRIVLFWPADQPRHENDDPTIGWGAVAQTVDVHTVPGDHYTIVTRHIHIIGERLAAYL